MVQWVRRLPANLEVQGSNPGKGQDELSDFQPGLPLSVMQVGGTDMEKASSRSDGTINRGPVCYRLCTLKIPRQLEIEKEQANAAALAKFPSLHTAWHCPSSLAQKVQNSRT